MDAMIRHVARWTADEDGTAAVEFAIIAPVFILMLAFMVNGGLHFYAHSTIVLNAREAARGLALGYMDRDEAAAFATEQTVKDLGVRPVVDIKAANVPLDPDVVVKISIDKSEMSKFAPFSALMPFAISTFVTMRSVP